MKACVRDFASQFALPVVALGALAGHFLSTHLWGAALALFAYSVGTYLPCILRGRAESVKDQIVNPKEESALRIVVCVVMLGLCSIPMIGTPMGGYVLYLAAMVAGLWAGERSGKTSPVAAGALLGGVGGVCLAVLVGLPLWLKAHLPWSTSLGLAVGLGVSLATFPWRSPRWSLDPYGSASILQPLWPIAGIGLARLCQLSLPEGDQHYGMLGDMMHFTTPIVGAVVGLFLGAVAGLFSRRFQTVVLDRIGSMLEWMSAERSWTGARKD